MRVKSPPTTSVMLRGSEGGIAHEQNAKTNNRNTQPPARAHVFVEPEVAQQSHNGVRNRRGGLHVAKIRPRKHKGIADQIGQQGANSKPHGGGGEGAEKKM